MDVKYSYYNTSKGYRVVGGTAAHFLKADGSLDNTSYIPVNTEINMGNKNLNFTSGSLSKVENGSRVFNKVFQNYTQSAQTGILSIKFPQASTAATMFDVTIKIFNYQAAYLGSIRVAFYKQTATVIHSTGRKCLIECTDNFPSTIVNVGMDLSGNICINLGDINTVWNLHTNIEVERVSTTYTGYNFDWSKGWSQTVETVAPVVPTTYQSLVSIPTEIGATRSWINSGLANVVTTNTTQTGLTGDKTTSGTWTFNGTTATGINLLRPANTINNSIGIGFDTVSTYFGLADSNTFAVGISNNLSALTNRSFWIDHPTFTANLRGGIGGSGLTAKDIGGFTISTATNNSKAEMILRHVWSAKNQTFGIGGISSPTSGSMSQWGLTKWLNDRTVNGNDGFFGWFGDTDILRATSLAGTGTRMVTADSSGILSTQIIPAIPTAQNLSTNPTIAGTIDISGGGTSANLQSLLPISKSDANVRSMRNEMQPYFTSGGSVNYPSQIGAGIRVERYSSASDQRGFNIWSAGSNGQIYFKTFSGSVSESSFETFASREWSNGQFSLLDHTHTFASLTSKPTTLTGYGITDAMSTSHPANGITTTLINNWNNAYSWGNHKAINDNQWLGSDYVSGGLEKPNSSYFGAGKLKLQMLSGGTNNLPSGTDTWNDVLWMSSYKGGDVKKSTAIISSKQSNKIGFSKQDYDSATWGNYIEFWTTANLDPNDFATLSMLNGFVSKTGDTMTGTLSINSAGQVFVVRGTDQTSNYMSWLKYDGSKAIAYIGADGGAAIGNGGTGDNFAITSAGGGDLILQSSSGNIQILGQLSTNNHGNSAQWISAYNNSLMNRGGSFINNIDANALPQGTEIMSIELPNGTGNTNFPFNDYGTFMRMKSNSFTSDFAHQHGGDLWFRNWYNPSGASSNWRKAWDSLNLPNPATETWVNTNFIPKSHPVYNITQAAINSWNNAVTYSHQHWNFAFLDNIDQYLGTGQAPQFSSVRLMNNLGYGVLALEEDYIGSELGLVDLTNEVIYAGRVGDYLKYGCSVSGVEGLNIEFNTRQVTIGKEITNDEDKVQIAGNISVDTVNISNIPTELILNPLYNTDGNVRRSRNAHIYIVTGNSVRLPDKPILGQRIEIFNDSGSDIEVTHGNVGTMFYVPRFCKVTGIVGARGFIFDEKPVPAKKYDV